MSRVSDFTFSPAVRIYLCAFFVCGMTALPCTGISTIWFEVLYAMPVNWAWIPFVSCITFGQFLSTGLLEQRCKIAYLTAPLIVLLVCFTGITVSQCSYGLARGTAAIDIRSGWYIGSALPSLILAIVNTTQYLRAQQSGGALADKPPSEADRIG